MSSSFVAQIMAPGGGIHLVPFTRGVVFCLFLTTTTVFIQGVARLHMGILSLLSVGFYIALGIFQKEYKKFLNRDDGVFDPAAKKSSSSSGSSGSSGAGSTRVSKAKRED